MKKLSLTPTISIVCTLFINVLCNGAVFPASLPYELVTEWGSSGSEDGQFLEPYGIAIDGTGNIYVSDPMNHRIQKFTPDGGFIARWGEYGSEEGQFIAPQGIDIDREGNVYVADFINDRIQKFTGEGAFIASWSTRVEGWWLYSSPRGLAVDGEGSVYVHHASLTPPDLYYTCIQKFTSEGLFIKRWPFIWFDALEMATDQENNLFVPATIIGPVQVFNTGGELLYQVETCGPNKVFCTTTGIALDNEGNIYVSDALNHCIKKFAPDGTLITSWVLEGEGGFGSAPSPYGLAVDNDGSVYVADTANARVRKYAAVSTTTTTTPGCPVEILYGSKARETETLRSFRDEVLSTTPEGREIIDLYYRLSPILVQAMAHDEELANKLKALLDCLF